MLDMLTHEPTSLMLYPSLLNVFEWSGSSDNQVGIRNGHFGVGSGVCTR